MINAYNFIAKQLDNVLSVACCRMSQLLLLLLLSLQLVLLLPFDMSPLQLLLLPGQQATICWAQIKTASLSAIALIDANAVAGLGKNTTNPKS